LAWAGGAAVSWAAGLAGWMCCRVLDWREGTRSTGSNRAGNQRCIRNSGHNFLHLSKPFVQKILKINENAEKTLWWDGSEQPCHLYPWISNQDLWCKADFPKRICVYFCGLVCGVWLAACLVSLACCGTGSGAGLPRAGGLRRYKIDRFVIITFLRFFSGWRVKCWDNNMKHFQFGTSKR